VNGARACRELCYLPPDLGLDLEAPATPELPHEPRRVVVDVEAPVPLGVRAEGPAAGPYPGTFEETGTFKLGEPITSDPRFRRVESFQAEFTIVSPAGRVTGTKELVLAPTTPLRSDAACGVGFPTASGTRLLDFAQAIVPEGIRYEATIETPSGTFRDQGASGVNVIYSKFFTLEGQFLGQNNLFFENFRSDLTEPVRVRVADEDDEDEDEEEDEEDEEDEEED